MASLRMMTMKWGVGEAREGEGQEGVHNRMTPRYESQVPSAVLTLSPPAGGGKKVSL